MPLIVSIILGIIYSLIATFVYFGFFAWLIKAKTDRALVLTGALVCLLYTNLIYLSRIELNVFYYLSTILWTYIAIKNDRKRRKNKKNKTYYEYFPIEPKSALEKYISGIPW